MNKLYDLVGIGVGPFNLSLAALLEKAPLMKTIFLERKPNFEWHSELMFQDSVMQTTYMKDLVTPVDPTSSYSFLNYLNKNDLFYAFLNTQRSVISRREFEQYCAWVSERLQDRLKFNTEVQNVEYKQDLFTIATEQGEYHAKNICIATGMVQRVPEVAKAHIGAQVFHAKSAYMKDLNLKGKSVLIVGGGQTGIEVFSNLLEDRWGRAASVQLVSRRQNLEPLDESAFTNEYFTPQYVDGFWNLSADKKSQIVASQKLASDGNTPSYLAKLFNDLYRIKHVEKDARVISLKMGRKLVQMKAANNQFISAIENCFTGKLEEINADVVILCTGFETQIPKALEGLKSKIHFDSQGRFEFNKNYSIQWDSQQKNKIYALNFSRHNHGIVDPQTSLMAWRSACVINDLTESQLYRTNLETANFIDFGV